MELKISGETAEILMQMDFEARHSCLESLMRFVFYGEDEAPDDPAAKIAYGFLKLSQEAKNANAERGRQGGRPKAEKAAERNEEPETVQNIRVQFTPPSVDDVAAYCAERRNVIDAAAFVNFYQSKGWYVGSRKMSDWRAAVRTWESKSRTRADDVSASRRSEAVLNEALAKVGAG